MNKLWLLAGSIIVGAAVFIYTVLLVVSSTYSPTY